MVQFTVDVARRDGESVLSVAGELDLATVGALSTVAADELGDPEVQSLALDLSRLTFLDSTGLGCLLDVHRLASRTAKPLHLSDVPPPILRVLQLGGVADLLLGEDERG